MLRLHLFGHPHFEYDGGPYRFAAGRRALAIVCYLALKARTPVSRDSVAFALWPDSEEEDARTALRRELHRAVKALPSVSPDEPWIVADELTLQWNPAAPCWIDVHAFEAFIDNRQDLAGAAALYRGDLLENVHEDWVFNDREKLRAAYMFALGEVLVKHRSARAYSAAIACAQQILAADPFREDAVRALLAVRYESGDRAGALRDADRYARLYKDELGVSFMPETEALREIIAANRPLKSEPVREEPAHERVLITTPFVGRAQELEYLRLLWSRAVRGSGSVAFIGGEAGIGKSRLVDELALLAEREGGRVLYGYTSSPEAIPYEVLSTSLQNAGALLAGVAADQSMLAAISKIVPRIADYGKHPVAKLPELDPALEQQRLFSALAHYVSALSRPRPLLLVFEDLHWAGSSTLAALRTLAERVRSLPLLVTVTYRAEEAFEPLSALRRDLVGARLAHHMALRRLSDRDVRTVVRGVEKLADADESLVEEFVAVADGHPFFLVEALTQYASSDSPFTEISHGIRGIIDARLQNLPEQALKAAEIAANIGDRFMFDVLLSVSGLDEGDLLQAVARLTDAHILQETSGRSAFDYCFTHHLIRGAIYDRIEPDRRRRRHYRIAQALAGERFREHRVLAGEIARHYDLANAREAAFWYGRAARDASAAYANSEALAYLERGITLARDAADRFELLNLRESLRRRLGDTAGRREDIQAMGTIVPELGESRIFDVLTRRVELSLNEGNYEEARALMHDLERYAAPDEPRRDAIVAFAKARILWVEGRLVESLEWAQSALRGFEKSGDSQGELETHCLIVDLCIKGADFDRAREHIDRAKQVGLGNTERLARTLLAASRESFAKARYDEAELLAREAHKGFMSMGDRAGIADAAFGIANALGRLQRFREAMAFCAEATEIYSSIGNRVRVAAVSVNLGTLYSWRGSLHEARACFTAAQKVFHELEDLRGETITTGNIGWIELMLGNNDRARTYSIQAIKAARHMQMPTLEGEFLANLGAAERELGNVKASINHLERCIELRGRALTRSDLFNDLCELALSYARGGDFVRAADLTREAVAYARGNDRTVWLHYVLWTAARAFALCGLYREAEDTRLLAREQMLRHRAEIQDDPAALDAFDELPLHRDIETSFIVQAK